MDQPTDPEETPKLRDGIVTYGPPSSEFEDFLFGDREGLEALAEACKLAVRDGKYSDWVGDFPGIVCKETSFFDDPDESGGSSDWGCCVTTCLVIAALASLLVLGAVKAYEMVSQ